MKKFEKFLFFYSIVAITVFFISFGIFSPSPLNFVSGILLLPLIFYFWVRVTNPENITPERWSVRFLTATVLLILLGIFGFYLKSHVLPQVSSLSDKIGIVETLNEKVTGDLASVSAELDKLRQGSTTPSAKLKTVPDSENLSISDLINASPSAGSSQRVTGSTGLKTVDVYGSPSSTSPKIGTIDGSITYPYITKQSGWYKIVMTSTQTGWVSQSQVQEVQ
jgi:hypothetical protein